MSQTLPRASNPPSGTPPDLILQFARNDDADSIEKIVKSGIPVNHCNRIGQTALHVAAIQGSLNAITKLVQLGLDVNVTNAMYQTPLHFAAGAHKNALEACSLLMDLGADPSVPDQQGRLPYEIAQDPTLRAMLGGPDPRLFIAAEAGDVATLRALFQEDPEAEAAPIGTDGASPLHLAARNGHMGALNFLLERGAHPDQHNAMTGDTAVHVAVREGHGTLLLLLLRRGADVNARNFHSSQYASGSWTSNGVNLGPLHQTPLHVAVEECNLDMIGQLLRAATVDPNVEDFDGRTPLHYALEFQEYDILEVLLNHKKTDPNKGCKDFATPLHYASSQGELGAVKLLLQHGADKDACDEQGWTPLMVAVRGGKVGVVKELMGAGAEVGAVNGVGNTALHIAATNGREEVCRALMAGEGGAVGGAAAVTVKNKEGKTAVECAKNDAIKQIFGAS